MPFIPDLPDAPGVTNETNVVIVTPDGVTRQTNFAEALAAFFPGWGSSGFPTTIMSAPGTTAPTATEIAAPGGIFTSVALGGLARLPAAPGVSNVLVYVLNRNRLGITLGVLPDDGGQIEDRGVNAAVGIADGGYAAFFSPTPAAGRLWFMLG